MVVTFNVTRGQTPCIKGTIKVEAMTTGSAQLAVKVGNVTLVTASKTERGDVLVNYDVAEDSYVYIYAFAGTSNAPAQRASSVDMVKVFSITVTPGTTGIDMVRGLQSATHCYYTLDGRKLNSEPTTKGIYIINGKKVVVK